MSKLSEYSREVYALTGVFNALLPEDIVDETTCAEVVILAAVGAGIPESHLREALDTLYGKQDA